MTRGRYTFLRSARWARIIALGVLVSTACVALGYWQWTRHSARAAAAAQVDAAYDATPVALGDLLVAGQGLTAGDSWRPVTVVGTYVPRGSVLLRNRPVSGVPAVHVLAPFVVLVGDEAPALLVVDRGWLPAGAAEDPVAVPAPPPGEVELLVRLRPPERPSGRQAPSGQAYSIDPAAVVAEAGVTESTELGQAPVLAAYGILERETPGAPTAPRPLPRPDTALGTHLSYTFQWWLFAAGALVGVGVLARREAAALDPRACTTESDRRPSRAPTPRRRARVTAEQEEDALVEAATRAAARSDGPGGPGGAVGLTGPTRGR